MLGIVLAGIMVLVVTHVLGVRNTRRPQRKQLSRIMSVEAVYIKIGQICLKSLQLLPRKDNVVGLIFEELKKVNLNVASP